MDPHKEHAQQTLIHYFKEVWRKAGLKWGSDNDAEVRGIVDDLVLAATPKPPVSKVPPGMAAPGTVMGAAAAIAANSRTAAAPVPPKPKGKL